MDKQKWMQRLRESAKEYMNSVCLFRELFIERVIHYGFGNVSVWAVAYFRHCATILTLSRHLSDSLNGADDDEVENVLVQYTPLFELYCAYFESKEKFKSLLNEMRFIVQECECDTRWPSGSTVEDLMEVPMGQISVYRDLVEKLLLTTPDQDVESRGKLKRVANCIESTQQRLNFARDRHVNDIMVNTIAKTWDTGSLLFDIKKAGRRFIKQGDLDKVSRKSLIRYRFVLFNDVLIYGSRKLLNGHEFRLHNVLLLDEMRVGIITNDHSEDAVVSTLGPPLGTATLSILDGLTKDERGELSFGIFTVGNKSFRVKSCADDLCEWWISLSKAVSLRVENAEKKNFSPIWQPDQHAPNCNLCQIPFTMIRRRHHCRMCGLIICNECSKNRQRRKVSSVERASVTGGVESTMKSVRVCNDCVSSTGRKVASVERTLSRRLLKKEPILDDRTRISLEILETEVTYQNNLKTLQYIHVAPLLHDFRTGGPLSPIVEKVEPSNLASMFVFLSDIQFILALSERLLVNLETRDFEEIGTIFLEISPLFQLYDEFSSSFEFATNTIRESNLENGHELASLFILPIQRLPRYVLLLREIQKKAPDTPNIQSAIDSVKGMTSHINEKIREREGMLRMYQLETQWGPVVRQGNEFVYEGKLVKQSRKSLDEYQFLLLDNVLMYGRQDSNLTVNHHRTLQLEHCSVGPSLTDEEGQYGIDIQGREKSFKVFAPSEIVQKEWLRNLESTIDKIKTNSTVEQAPIWVKDQPACAHCKSKFSLLLRRHHCRSCGQCLCNTCTSQRFLLRHVDPNVPSRVCKPCYKHLSRPTPPKRSSSITHRTQPLTSQV